MDFALVMVAWFGLSFILAVILGKAIKGPSEITDEQWEEFVDTMRQASLSDDEPYDWRAAGGL